MADETLMELIDAYAEARHVGGCHTYNAKTAEARAKVVAYLAASAGSEPVAWFVEEHSDIQDLEWNRLKPTYPGNWKPLYTHPSPPEGAGWISVKDRLPPCRDDQDYIGINSAGFAGVFNAVRVIDGNTYCLMETAEESVSIMSDLAIWKPFIRPLPAPPASEAKGA